MKFKTTFWILLAALMPVWGVAATVDSDRTVTAASQTAVCTHHLPGIQYAFDLIEEPRPIRIHVLTVDLVDNRVEPVTVIADNSPDEEFNAIRTDPRLLAAHPRLLAFVNANPWTPWAPTYPVNVNIIGLAATEGRVVSPHHGVSVWTDISGRAHIGEPNGVQTAPIREGVGGFQQILKHTRLTVQQGGPLHPRTAIGINEQGNRLYFVVADGRQPGFSEGMTLGELAVFMRELGCWDAANMDGGGSSVLGITDHDGHIKILNKPPGSAGYLRPLPIVLSIREKQTDNDLHEYPLSDPNQPSPILN